LHTNLFLDNVVVVLFLSLEHLRQGRVAAKAAGVFFILLLAASLTAGWWSFSFLFDVLLSFYPGGQLCRP